MDLKEMNPDMKHRCSSCFRQLSVSQFYYCNGRLDCYCKECRRKRNRAAKKKKNFANELKQSDEPRYPVITQIADRDHRLALILHAKQVLRERILRARRRRWEADNDEND